MSQPPPSNLRLGSHQELNPQEYPTTKGFSEYLELLTLRRLWHYLACGALNQLSFGLSLFIKWLVTWQSPASLGCGFQPILGLLLLSIYHYCSSPANSSMDMLLALDGSSHQLYLHDAHFSDEEMEPKEVKQFSQVISGRWQAVLTAHPTCYLCYALCVGVTPLLEEGPRLASPW